MNRRLPSQQAKSIISIKGLAPLARAHAGRPRDYLDPKYPDWAIRARQAEHEVVERLRAEGVKIDIEDDGAVRIAFAGIVTTSRLGLRKALQNWRAKAEGKRVDQYFRNGGKSQ